jgi:uncharacterized protein
MLCRAYKLELREMQESTGEFTGYASVFRVLNPYYDEVIEPGAFTQTLSHNGGRVPITADHGEWIGNGLDASEDDYGLAVHGKLEVGDVQAARERWALMRGMKSTGRAPGLSIGFRSIQSTKDAAGTTHRTEVALEEYAVTPWQSLEPATVGEMRTALSVPLRMGIITAEQYDQALAAARATPDARDAHEADFHSISAAIQKAIDSLRAA